MKHPPLLCCALILIACCAALQRAEAQQWTRKSSGVAGPLYDVYFLPDATQATGFIVGHAGTILKTTDGGMTWRALTSGVAFKLRGVHFIDRDHGFVVGDSGAVLATSDGGETWERRTTATDEELNAVTFADAVTGVAVGGFLGGQTLLKTTDAGKTWRSITIESVPFNDAPLTDISFPSPTIGYTIGRGFILKSTDAGETWNSLAFSPDDVPFSIMEACRFVDTARGFVGGWYDPALSQTTDGGATWQDRRSDDWSISYQLYDIDFPTARVGYACGWKGQIIRSDDGGESWRKTFDHDSVRSILAIHCLDESTCCAVTEQGEILLSRPGTSSVSRTDNASQNVTIHSVVLDRRICVEIALPNGNEASDVRLTVVDALGRIVERRTYPGASDRRYGEIDLSGLPAGAYYVRVEADDATAIDKILLP